jgi:hypothetical protein
MFLTKNILYNKAKDKIKKIYRINMVDKVIQDLALKQSRFFKFPTSGDRNIIYDIKISNGHASCNQNIVSRLLERANTFMSFIDQQQFHQKIQLAFSISFEDKCDFEGCFTYSKTRSAKSVLVPDHYAIRQYDGKLKINTYDVIPRSDQLVFYGTDTGEFNNLHNNRRLSFCNKFVDSKNIHARITKYAQNGLEKVKSFYPNYESFTQPPVSIQTQLQHKFILSIDGNASAWDRVPWILNSNSLLFLLDPQFDNWFYPVLRDRYHYILCDMDDVEKKLIFYRNNPAQVHFMTRNARQFVKDFIVKEQQEKYFKNLVQFCYEKYIFEQAR